MMVPSDLVIDLSRIQFAVTALYHFLFVPLTLGMSWFLVVMEAAYLKTGKQVYKDMTRFWGKLFAINFAMGVVTGITLEFEFGQNWAYFARFIGDTFGAALAIEGVTAFMTEATMFGLFFFTWDKISKRAHFIVTVVLALGTNLSIVNILVANSWMQDPSHAYLNYHTMTMHLTSFVGIYTHELAQIRVGHVLFAGLLVASTFVLGVSSYYLLKRRDTNFAMRSYSLAAGIGLCAACAVFFLGDANGVAVAKYEPAKMAGIEGQWVTQKPPAAWYPIAFPMQKAEKNEGVIIKIPYMLSLIAHHDIDQSVEGLKEVMQGNQVKIHNGIKAYMALKALRTGHGTAADKATFLRYRKDIGYGFLVHHYVKDPAKATPAQLEKVTRATIPEVWVLFWAFRVMLAIWGVLWLLMALAFLFTSKRTISKHRWLLWGGVLAIPLPYMAAEAGWLIAEMGRQPWVVRGILPTDMGVSSLHWHTVAFSLGGFALFYFILFVVMVTLMFKVARKGPSALGEGRYHFESITHQA